MHAIASLAFVYTCARHANCACTIKSHNYRNRIENCDAWHYNISLVGVAAFNFFVRFILCRLFVCAFKLFSFGIRRFFSALIVVVAFDVSQDAKTDGIKYQFEVTNEQKKMIAEIRKRTKRKQLPTAWAAKLCEMHMCKFNGPVYDFM